MAVSESVPAHKYRDPDDRVTDCWRIRGTEVTHEPNGEKNVLFVRVFTDNPPPTEAEAARTRLEQEAPSHPAQDESADHPQKHRVSAAAACPGSACVNVDELQLRQNRQLLDFPPECHRGCR